MAFSVIIFGSLSQPPNVSTYLIGLHLLALNFDPSGVNKNLFVRENRYQIDCVLMD